MKKGITLIVEAFLIAFLTISLSSAYHDYNDYDHVLSKDLGRYHYDNDNYYWANDYYDQEIYYSYYDGKYYVSNDYDYYDRYEFSYYNDRYNRHPRYFTAYESRSYEGRPEQLVSFRVHPFDYSARSHYNHYYDNDYRYYSNYMHDYRTYYNCVIKSESEGRVKYTYSAQRDGCRV